ncbi:MAG: alpha/beta hydrolase [Candidatus Saccharibacteria bacterium]
MLNYVKRLLNIFSRVHTLFVSFDSGGRNKKTMVLLHGIAATSKTWDLLIKDIDKNNFRVVALDLLGFGQSPKPVNCDYNVDDHCDSIHKTLKKLKIRKPYQIIGHSMGAIIAAHYCCRYNQDVKKVFLLSLPLYLDKNELGFGFLRTRTDLFLDAYRFLLDKKSFTIKNSQFIRNLFRISDGIDVNEENWEGFRFSLKNTVIEQNAYEDIKNIHIPTYIMYGTLDQFLIQESINRLSVFDNILITKLKGVDHSIGKKFARAVAEKISE